MLILALLGLLSFWYTVLYFPSIRIHSYQNLSNYMQLNLKLHNPTDANQHKNTKHRRIQLPLQWLQKQGKNSNDISAVQFNSHYSLVLKKPRTRNTVITWYHSFKLMDNHCMNSIYIRTLSFYCLFSALLNWFKLVYGQFGQINMHCTLGLRPASKESNVPKLKSS